jgi:RNA polymerase sigma-70 factor (ECF subfamily)
MTIPLSDPGLPPAADHPQPLLAPSDAQLAIRARRGDDLAFELIMRRHNRRLFRLARSLVGRDHEAEDVLQEAYVRAYTRLDDLASDDALGGWLARIVANEAFGRLRAAARVVSLEEFRAKAAMDQEDDADRGPASDQPDPERLAASSELRRLLEVAVDALPEEFRTVFVLREVEGLSTAETAAYLAIRPETVKTRLHRARRQLQEALGVQLLAASPSLFAFQGRRCDRMVSRVLGRLPPPPALSPSPAGEPTRSAIQARPSLLHWWLGWLAAFLDRRRKG